MSTTTQALLIAVMTVVVFSVLAFLAIRLLNVQYGETVFVVVPFLGGLIAGMHSPTMKAALFAIIFGFGVCLAALLFLGLEAVICVLMASPLVVGLAYVGALLGRVIKRTLSSGPGGKGSALALLLGLLLVGCSAMLEGGYVRETPMHTVETVRTFPVGATDVWDALLSFQQIKAEKPWLLKLGLPVPQYCTIDGSGVGATRICHFDRGVIEERVSVWQPPRRLVMEITNVTLPGRDWLKFIDASYELSGTEAGHTRVRRTTRIASVLRPRLYWRPLEELATQAEHQYLFHAVASKLAPQYPSPWRAPSFAPAQAHLPPCRSCRWYGKSDSLLAL